MRSRLRLLPLIGVLLWLGLGLSAQISSHTAYSFRSGASLPAACNAGPPITDTYYLTSGSTGLYTCTATNTWTLVSGGGGSGVTTLQIDTNNALSGAVQLLSGPGLSSSCASGGTASPCTFTVNNATSALLGGLKFGGDLGSGSAWNSQQVVGLHFGTNALTLSATAPTANAPLCADGSNVIQTATCTTGASYTAQIWQTGVYSTANTLAPTGGDMTLNSVEFKTPQSVANFAFDVSTADAGHNVSICLYGPYTSSGISTPLAASTTAAAYGSTGTQVVAAASPATLAAGIYFLGVNLASGSTFNMYVIQGTNDVMLYSNPAFATSQTGTCPATITAPVLAAVVNGNTPPWVGVTGH